MHVISVNYDEILQDILFFTVYLIGSNVLAVKRLPVERILFYLSLGKLRHGLRACLLQYVFQLDGSCSIEYYSYNDAPTFHRLYLQCIVAKWLIRYGCGLGW